MRLFRRSVPRPLPNGARFRDAQDARSALCELEGAAGEATRVQGGKDAAKAVAQEANMPKPKQEWQRCLRNGE